MKYSKIKSIIVFSVIILLIINSVGSFGSSNEENEKNQKTNIKIKKAAISIKTSNTKDEPYNGKSQTLGDNGFNDLDNIIVSKNIGNESYPSMVMEGYSGLVAYEYEDVRGTHVHIRNSKNYGQNWSGAIKIVAKLDNSNPDIEINSPSLCTVPISKEAYGAYVSPFKNSAVFGYFEINDFVDLDNINTFTYEWTGFPDQDDPNITYAFWDFKNPEIVTYKDTINPWVIILIGSTNYTYEGVGACTNSPMFFFTDLEYPEQYDVLTWFPEIQNCSNISISRYYDSSVKYIYGICEINNGLNQELLFFKGSPYLWYYGDELLSQILTNSENLTHPQIFVKENLIYIVADSDSQGIVLYNSSDGGDTWDSNQVTADIMPSSANPNYPMFYANDTHLFCAFIESGNISLTNSTNYGLNWSLPEQLNNENGSVVEEYQFADFSDKNHILWTDNRKGDPDIYAVILGIPEADLTILPTSVKIVKGNFLSSTKNWITFTVQNNGELWVEKIPVQVTYTCFNESPKTTEYGATVYYLDAFGAEESFKRPLFRLNIREFTNALIDYAGIQNITITVDPENVYDDKYPKDNSFTYPVTYKNIFPRLAFLENFFVRI